MLMTNPDFLRGPWVAVLADPLGFVYDSPQDARENADDPTDDFRIRIVRDSALPNDRSGDRLRLPSSYHEGDIAHDLYDVWLVDADEESVGAEARRAQAQAMAAGLNAAGQVTA